ncbi:hypothetical protein L916_03651 [Phytophthora nicotianae]|uniref:Uncharacterized protein n=1 Tax=Phytophthora nicotianae TaxID=4792 RepID=W2JJ87_PHYNI|nr:hypothetical protein L916_03651 [Phytophthora nicotianae]
MKKPIELFRVFHKSVDIFGVQLQQLFMHNSSAPSLKILHHLQMFTTKRILLRTPVTSAPPPPTRIQRHNHAILSCLQQPSDSDGE